MNFDSSSEILLREAAGPGKGGKGGPSLFDRFKNKKPPKPETSDGPEKTPETDTPESEKKPKEKESEEDKTKKDKDKSTTTDSSALNEMFKKYMADQKAMSSSNDPVTRVLGMMLNMSAQQGTTADKLAKEYTERENIIRQFLSFTNNEFQVAKIFAKFRDESIPWLKQKQIMDAVIKSATSGIDIIDAIDLAIEYYVTRRDVEDTVSIINDAASIQQKHREFNVANLLKNAVRGNFRGFDVVFLGRRNIEDALLLNKIISLVAYKPSEDVYILTRQRLLDEDKATLAREIDDRIKAVFQTLLDSEFQIALRDATNFVTQEFKIAVTDPKTAPLYYAFRRTMYQLKLAGEFRKQILSGEESRTTTEQSQEKSRSIFNSANKFIRLGQTQNDQPAVIPAAKAKKLQSTFQNLSDQFKLYLNRDLKPNIVKRQSELQALIKAGTDTEDNRESFAALSLLPVAFSTLSSNFESIARKLSLRKDVTDQELIIDYTNAFAGLRDIKNKYSKFASANSTFASFPRKFVRLGQTAGTATTGSGLGLTEAAAGIFSGLELNPDAFMSAIIGKDGKPGINLFTMAAAILTGDPRQILANFTVSYLMNINKINGELAKYIGRPIPRETAGANEIAAGKRAFYSLLLLQDQNIYQQFEAQRTDILLNIKAKETQLQDLIESNVQTGTNRNQGETAFLQDKEKAKQQYDSFIAYLKTSVQIMSAYYDWTRDKVNRIQTDRNYNPSVVGKEPNLFQIMGPVKEFQFTIERDLQEISNKLGEYYSLDKIISDILGRKQLVALLQSMIPNLEAYLATGSSVVDLLRAPGGVLGVVREIYDTELRMQREIFSQLEKWKNAKNLPLMKKKIKEIVKAADDLKKIQQNNALKAGSGSTASLEGYTKDSSGNMFEAGDAPKYVRDKVYPSDYGDQKKKYLTEYADTNPFTDPSTLGAGYRNE